MQFYVSILHWTTFSTFKIFGGGYQERYGQNTVKKLRKLEKLGCRLRKAQIDLKFLVNCSNNSVAPKFLNFHVLSKCFKSLRTYQQCLLSLSHEEIHQKKSNIRVLLKEFEFLNFTSQTEISFIDFAYVPLLFWAHNDKVLKHESTIQQKNLNNLRNRNLIKKKLFLIIVAMFYQKRKISSSEGFKL